MKIRNTIVVMSLVLSCAKAQQKKEPTAPPPPAEDLIASAALDFEETKMPETTAALRKVAQVVVESKVGTPEQRMKASQTLEKAAVASALAPAPSVETNGELQRTISSCSVQDIGSIQAEEGHLSAVLTFVAAGAVGVASGWGAATAIEDKTRINIWKELRTMGAIPDSGSVDMIRIGMAAYRKGGDDWAKFQFIAFSSQNDFDFPFGVYHSVITQGFNSKGVVVEEVKNQFIRGGEWKEDGIRKWFDTYKGTRENYDADPSFPRLFKTLYADLAGLDVNNPGATPTPSEKTLTSQLAVWNPPKIPKGQVDALRYSKFANKHAGKIGVVVGGSIAALFALGLHNEDDDKDDKQEVVDALIEVEKAHDRDCAAAREI